MAAVKIVVVIIMTKVHQLLFMFRLVLLSSTWAISLAQNTSKSILVDWTDPAIKKVLENEKSRIIFQLLTEILTHSSSWLLRKWNANEMRQKRKRKKFSRQVDNETLLKFTQEFHFFKGENSWITDTASWQLRIRAGLSKVWQNWARAERWS